MRWNKALQDALPVLRLLNEQGHEAVFVGGCVRDTVMGRELKDVDIATSAEPQQVMEIFPRHVPTGLKHGTITVMTDQGVYEVTTFRKESAYEQYRRPSEVQFVTDLEADLLRRDFTINAMALHADGTLSDPFGGLHDLRQGVLRCVGEADARFQEDALRMVRAIRFAAEFRLRVELRTWQALKRHRTLLKHVAMERVGAEADKMMSGSHPERAAALFAASGLLGHTKVLLPEALLALGSREASRTGDLPPKPRYAFAHAMDELVQLKDADTRWSSLCLAAGMSADDAWHMADALKFSNVRKSAIAADVRIGRRMEPAVHRSLEQECSDDELRHIWLEAVMEEGRKDASRWLSAVRAIPILLAPPNDRPFDLVKAAAVADKLEQWLAAIPITAIRELAIGGKDVVRLLQRPEGPWVGQLLQQLFRAVVHRQVDNERDSLLAFLKERPIDNGSEMEKT